MSSWEKTIGAIPCNYGHGSKKIKLPLVHILCLVSLVDILCQEDPKELYQYDLIGIKCRILNN